MNNNKHSLSFIIERICRLVHPSKRKLFVENHGIFRLIGCVAQQQKYVFLLKYSIS